MLAIYLDAPFAAFRSFTAGWYRPTATFLTPSAAYGLVLNLAGIDSRLREESADHPGKIPASLIRHDLPECRIAIGAATFQISGRRRIALHADDLFPKVQSMFQQLHNYPVGTSGGDRADTTFGNKYNITPVRREYLSKLHAILAIDGNEKFESLVRNGLQQGGPPGRYGLPFLGDNSFLIDRCEEIFDPLSAYWYERVASDESGPQNRNSRMTITIDRADLSKSVSDIFAPVRDASDLVPTSAWVEMAGCAESN